MKILELTNYSAGICGVWTRVKQEAELFAKARHEVRVFSSNGVKGSDEIALRDDKIGRVRIKRFNFRKLGGESFMYWNFEKEALEFKPDVIIAHSYRHPHTTKSLKIGKKTGARVFLVTHAPFGSGNRGVLSSVAVKFYDAVIGRRTLNLFEKVVAITKWEILYLKKLGVGDEKIAYIPNGIPDEFFSKSGKIWKKNKILFFGRISPVKDIETLLKSCLILKKKKIDFELEIVGPAEKDYLIVLERLIKKFGLEKKIKFSPAIYEVSEKIKKIDSASIFVLPSLREGMPQSLVEAMARGIIVVGSDNMGNKDLIENGKNGYLFPIGNASELAKALELGLDGGYINEKIRANAGKSVEQFKWTEVMKKWDKLLRN